jgi:hypothetical protein
MEKIKSILFKMDMKTKQTPQAQGRASYKPVIKLKKPDREFDFTKLESDLDSLHAKEPREVRFKTRRIILAQG